jgi:23S rRNA pseudouridine2605 synthase
MQRLSKVINSCGFCSRRDAEKIIQEGRVKVNGNIVSEVVTFVSGADTIEIDDIILNKNVKKLWIYYKPRGLINTHKDPQKRPTIFDNINIKIPHLISIGRLDIESEGLLLLTNDGALSRYFELPSNKIPRKYKVKVFGNLILDKIKVIENEPLINGIKYGKSEISYIKSNSKNHWFYVTLYEGKNREVRNLFEHIGLKVSRLIRISYGSYNIDDLKQGEVREVPFPNFENLLNT